MENAVEIFGLTKRFKAVACDQINLKIKKGTIFGLLGPNGCGKTTLLRILSTVILPDHGSAVIEGHDLLKQDQKVRASISLATSENSNFYQRLTGRQNLEIFAAFFDLP